MAHLGLKLAVEGAVRGRALRLAAERRDAPAVGLLAEEHGLTAREVDLRVRDRDLDGLHPAAVDLHVADRVRARLHLLALELLDRVRAERDARGLAVVGLVGGEE